MIDILKLVFLYNMYPFESFIAALKKYIRNRACPEGSITSSYETEEVIEFCVAFIDNLKPTWVHESRFEGRLHEKGTLVKKSYIR